MSLDIAKQGNVRRALPKDIALNENFKYGGVISRQDVYQQAEQTNYLPNQKIQFYLPSNMSDLREHTVQFKINGTAYGAPATFTRFEQGISCIFNRLEILFGSTTVMDIVNVNLLKSIIRYASPTNYTAQTGRLLEGTGNAVQRNADFANAARVYAVNFNCGLLKKVLPLNKLGSQMIIRLTLADPQDCLVTDDVSGTAGTYQVIDPEFHYSVLVMSAEWNQLYDSLVQERGGITVCYKTFDNFQSTNSLLLGVQNSQVVLPFRYSSLLAIMYVMRNSADLTNPLIEGKTTQFNFNNISGSRYKIDSVYYPTDTTRSVQDLYTEFLDTWNLGYYSDVLGGLNYDTNTFIQAQPLMKHPKDNRDIAGSINGLNTTSSGTSIVNEVRFNVALPAQQQTDFWAVHENCIKMLPNGSIQLFE
jgi:hypothetical protein